jgi:hypothetical protein
MLTLDGQTASFKNPPIKSPLPPFYKGGVGGFLREMRGKQC